MTKTAEQTAPLDTDTRDDLPQRPVRRRRILLMTVVATAILGLAALLFGGVLFNPAAASESEPTSS